MEAITSINNSSNNSTATDFSISLARICISDLRLRTYIGFNPEELEKQQDIIINADICYKADKASITDNEQDILDYKTITKQIIHHVENGQFRLLEKLVADVLHIIMDKEKVTSATVRIDKPHALRFADSVSVELSGFRE